VISGFRGGVRSSLFLDLTQRRLVVTDVSGQPIGRSCKGQAVQGELELFELWRWDRYDVPKRLTTNLRCVTSQKSEDCTYPHLDYGLLFVADLSVLLTVARLINKLIVNRVYTPLINHQF